MFRIDWGKLHCHLQENKQRLQEQISQAQKLRKFFKEVDGKVFDKRIAESINDMEGMHSYISKPSSDGLKEFSVWVSQRPHNDYILWARDVYSLCNGKRISAERVDKILQNNIQTWRQEVAQVESDLINAKEILEKMKVAAIYYTQLGRQLSSYSLSYCNTEIQITDYEIRTLK